ncbi:hypothetical protein BO94DRAFT_506218 [Aspergillus sclerotioniger CBS 115572]|uniref:VWFA domain-containing protein n=1 Tax=Aspergillus sclerotioniger CBS 115572 TaxID=1450535 RepID=A0A317XFT8_9EURO|nr:hypothetical protein BO94DRAFT_506218 [Aspergillus sclerotioniger CBS 115572]PWY96742.1 hypothetical protein BO94DRAFT_506218 [Aspergillus sclerotioniger CBS 115572]
MASEFDDEHDELSSVGDEEDDAINDIVAHVVDQFLMEFSRRLGIPHPEDMPLPPFPEAKIPETEEDYRRYVWQFIEQNLQAYYQPGDPYVEELVKNAAARTKNLTQKYELEPEVTPKLALMALYDFAILCDNSTSMKRGRGIRIQALEDTCQNVAEIGCCIQEQGVYLRFLNTPENETFTKLTSEGIRTKMNTVKYSGLTRLGTVLSSKIVKPLILDKLESDQLEKPLITIIITDGDLKPQGEDASCLEEIVLGCKRRLDEHSGGSAGAVFLISRVGNDPGAETFLSNLMMNKNLEETLYCCPDQLDERREVFRKAGKDRQYSSYLIKLFKDALESQTDM